MEDLFTQAAQDEAVPPEHWTRPDDAERDWNPAYGPHAGWDGVRVSTQPWEYEIIHPRKDGYAAKVLLCQDRTTKLWLFAIDTDGPISAHGSCPSYLTGGFRSRAAALSVGRVHALQKMAEHKATHEEYLKREREQKAWRRRQMVRNFDSEDDDETGEEGMAERFEDEG